MLKNCLAIHDLCCYSKSSLSVIIPVLETLNVEVCPLPTAILSTQTDGFENFFFKDLSDTIESIFQSWQIENLNFNCIYSGFLGNYKQIQFVKKVIENYKSKNTLIVVDPVLADNLEIYPTISKKHIELMKELIKIADIITPNLTEAAIILNKKPKNEYTKDEINSILLELKKRGPKKVIITSTHIVNQKEIFTCCIEDEKIEYIKSKKLNYSYPGTGDLFASIIVGLLLKDYKLRDACEIATQVCYKAMKITKENKIERKRGISTPLLLPLLFNK